MNEVGKDKATGIVRVQVNPKYYRPTEVVSKISVILAQRPQISELEEELDRPTSHMGAHAKNIKSCARLKHYI